VSPPCPRTGYPTAITAKKAAKRAGKRGLFRDIERCDCGKWHVKGA
jgi:hypothetical protein